LGAILLPFLVMIASWNSLDRKNIIVGALALGLIFGIGAIFILTIHSLWINFFALPIIELMVLMPFIIKRNR